MLIHICCSVDSHYFLRKIREIFPDEELIGFFYNPNIHPYEEYYLRLLDVRRSCEILGIELIEGEYDFQSWIKKTDGYEKEPEKGERCTLCFDIRVQRAMIEALRIGQSRVTTTLLTSPKKSIEKLKEVGETLADRYGVEFLTFDFRKNGGTQEQFFLAKRDKLYRQNYCGCVYALKDQRDAQRKEAYELFCPIFKTVLPNSFEERILIYEKRLRLEEEQKRYDIVKENFLNYRLLRAYILSNDKVIPSYFLSYSYLKREKSSLKIDKKFDNFAHSNRDNIVFIELELVNKILKKSLKTVKELYFKGLKIEEERQIREALNLNSYSLSPVVVIEKIDFLKFEIYCKAILFKDVRENLVIF